MTTNPKPHGMKRVRDYEYLEIKTDFMERVGTGFILNRHSQLMATLQEGPRGIVL